VPRKWRLVFRRERALHWAVCGGCGASVEYGTWYARSAEFLHSGGMNTLRWLRMIGDSIFAIGAVVLGWFVRGLVTGHSMTIAATSRKGSGKSGKSERRNSPCTDNAKDSNALLYRSLTRNGVRLRFCRDFLV
jgi:hypothetical protein